MLAGGLVGLGTIGIMGAGQSPALTDWMDGDPTQLGFDAASLERMPVPDGTAMLLVARSNRLVLEWYQGSIDSIVRPAALRQQGTASSSRGLPSPLFSRR